MLFGAPWRFSGLPADGFRAFDVADREQRREAIVRSLHPALAALGEDLLERLNPRAAAPLHAHLPRLDWPRGYRPFCTWLALSRLAQGYQAGPTLNVGVHRDHVAARLGWDASAVGFGRFEFLCRHGGLGEACGETAARHALAFRVYAAADWPQGSRLIFESASDWRAALGEARRAGVWFELGARYELPEAMGLVCSQAFGEEVERVFVALLPLLDRFCGGPKEPR